MAGEGRAFGLILPPVRTSASVAPHPAPVVFPVDCGGPAGLFLPGSCSTATLTSPVAAPLPGAFLPGLLTGAIGTLKLQPCLLALL